MVKGPYKQAKHVRYESRQNFYCKMGDPSHGFPIHVLKILWHSTIGVRAPASCQGSLPDKTRFPIGLSALKTGLL